MSDLDYGQRAETARLRAARAQIPPHAYAMVDPLADALAGFGERRDSNGYKPDRDMILSRWMHRKRGRVYVVVGFAWNGDADEWEIVHIGEDQPYGIFTRSVGNWNEVVELVENKGMARFQRLT